MNFVSQLQIVVALRKVFAQFAAEMKMKFSVNLVVQVICTLVQGLDAISGELTPKQREVAALVVGVLQAVSALLAHFTNPDGTPASQAYVAR